MRAVYICLVLLPFSLALPVDYSNPKSQVEYISLQPGGDKPIFMPITRPPLIDATPPPPPYNSKNFAYNPKTQTWTEIRAKQPTTTTQQQEDTLIWNQSNDKWLTNSPGA